MILSVCTYQGDTEVSYQSVDSERPVQTDKDKAVKFSDKCFDRCAGWKNHQRQYFVRGIPLIFVNDSLSGFI